MSEQFNLTRRLVQARALQHLKKQEGERIGTLRAGNSGIMSAQGQVAGECHRITHLRSLGIDTRGGAPDFATSIMFDRGYNNEEIILEDLQVTLNPGEVILREKQIETSWTTSNGTKVTGSPDFVIALAANQYTEGAKLITRGVLGEVLPQDRHIYAVPQYGIEAKSVASFWTSRDLLVDRQPKLPHMIQAAHYMWQMGIPWRLLYRQYALQLVPDWFKPKLPQPGERYSEFLEYNLDKPLRGGRQDAVDIKQVRPFELVYELQFEDTRDGRLKYREEGTDDEWKFTVIKRDDIRKYYEYVSTMGDIKQLGSRPIDIDLIGDKLAYSKCSYCPLQEVCDKSESKGYETWLSEVKKLQSKER